MSGAVVSVEIQYNKEQSENANVIKAELLWLVIIYNLMNLSCDNESGIKNLHTVLNRVYEELWPIATVREKHVFAQQQFINRMMPNLESLWENYIEKIVKKLPKCNS